MNKNASTEDPGWPKSEGPATLDLGVQAGCGTHLKNQYKLMASLFLEISTPQAPSAARGQRPLETADSRAGAGNTWIPAHSREQESCRVTGTTLDRQPHTQGGHSVGTNVKNTRPCEFNKRKTRQLPSLEISKAAACSRKHGQDEGKGAGVYRVCPGRCGSGWGASPPCRPSADGRRAMRRGQTGAPPPCAGGKGGLKRKGE